MRIHVFLNLERIDSDFLIFAKFNLMWISEPVLTTEHRPPECFDVLYDLTLGVSQLLVLQKFVASEKVCGSLDLASHALSEDNGNLVLFSGHFFSYRLLFTLCIFLLLLLLRHLDLRLVQQYFVLTLRGLLSIHRHFALGEVLADLFPLFLQFPNFLLNFGYFITLAFEFLHDPMSFTECVKEVLHSDK